MNASRSVCATRSGVVRLAATRRHRPALAMDISGRGVWRGTGLTISDVGPGAEVLSLWAFALVGDETSACPHLTGAAGDCDAHTVELPIVRMSRNEPEE